MQTDSRKKILKLLNKGNKISIDGKSYDFNILVNMRRFSESLIEEIKQDQELKDDQEIINVIDLVKKERNNSLKNRKFTQYDEDLKNYIRTMNTRQLLKMLRVEQEDYRNNYISKDWGFDYKDLLKQELNTREHIPNSIESKNIRSENASKGLSKKDKELKKLKNKISKLKDKYSLKEIATRLKHKEEFIREIMDD